MAMDGSAIWFDALNAQVGGRAYRRGEPGFAEHAGGFNVAVVNQPDAVVVAESSADVAAAVEFAGREAIAVAVQCSGHGLGATVSDGILISTRAMREVSIDVEARTATVAAGARWADVFAAAAPHGLGGLCGSTSDVGVVGFTLGGGLPVLGRAYGYACDQVRSMEVVTADGRRRNVDAHSEPDLFWALRGGAGGSGLVTSMTFELKELQHIYGGGIFFDGADAAAVLSAYASWTPTIPDDLCTSLAFLRLPPLPEVPEPLRGRFTVHLRVAYPGSEAMGQALLGPMRECAPVLMEHLAVMPYAALDAIHMDPPEPVPFDESGALVDELSSDLQQILLDQAGPGADCPFLLVEIRHLGGAMRTAADNAVSHRDAGFHVLAIEVPAPGAALTGATEHFAIALADHAVGYSVNLSGVGGGPDVARGCWSAQTYQRLQSIKRSYDPAGVFGYGRTLLRERS